MAKYSISCGGTGGHVFPGMATGAALQKRGHDVALWLSGKAIESATCHAWSGEVIKVESAKISFYPLRLPNTVLTVIRAFRTSVKALRAQQPKALLAMGSYSSLGPVLAARYLKIPVILHEANVVPGKAVSVLSRFASAVAITFPETRQYLKHRNIILTGLPLRKQMEEAATGNSHYGPKNTAVGTEPDPPERENRFYSNLEGRPLCRPANMEAHNENGLAAEAQTGLFPIFTVLTMGGSQGAQSLNEMVPIALGHLREAGIPVAAIHLAGEKAKPAVEDAYRKAGVPASVYGFCSDMVSVYRKTTLAISRSGANSCLELALFGIPAILIPLPSSARDHQRANAKAMMAAGAAILLEQAALTPDQLAETLRTLATNPREVTKMRSCAKARAATGADESLADLIVKVGGSR